MPFVRLFHGQPSQYLWEDAEGIVHTVAQGEGREQGDPFMPLLFSLGQHAALQAAHSRMRAGETLFAFLDDVFFVVQPDRVGEVYQVVEQELYRHSRITIHTGKTQVWNSAGDRPEACDALERITSASDPDARVWKGPGLLTSEHGVRVLGTPLGHIDFVAAQLTEKLAEHEALLARIPLVKDLQSAWALLLHCAGGRANYLLRVVRPELVREFAEGHNTGLFNCLCRIMNIVPGQIHELVKDIITIPLSIGGMGFRSAHRTSPPAYWASWADSLPMIRERHLEVARTIIDRAGRPNPPPSLESVVRVAQDLERFTGSKSQVGKHCHWERDQPNENRTSLSLVAKGTDGNTRLLHELGSSSGRVLCHVSQRVNKPNCGPRVALWLA